MAGIAGIILKNKREGADTYLPAFNAMIQNLAVSDSQLRKQQVDDSFLIGNVVTVSSKNNDHFQSLEHLKIYCVIDGLVFINDQEKSIIRKQYQINDQKSDYELLPYFYDFYSTDIVYHITGWYNIFLIDLTKQESFLFNDRLGYSPLYYYESDLFFVFASKIESILSSGLLANHEFDATTLAEQLFFNYPLSDHTFIKGIHTLPNATSVSFNSQGAKFEKYWGVEEFFDFKPAGEKESFNLINEGLQAATSKIISYPTIEVNLSLTGGWDSRVVLSLLMPEYKNKLRLYSFGAENSDDILIPQLIAKKENLNYNPYLLDQTYLDNEFISSAIKTIELSNGTRNYKRTHYLYAIQKIAAFSDLLISGIFGDEVIKVAHASGGTVISSNTIGLITSDFNIDQTLIKFNESNLLGYFQTDQKKLKDEFVSRISNLAEKTKKFNSISQKYYYVRFELNLRKYFGNEINSYNDYVYCTSPFIDHDFLMLFARTMYLGIHYPFNSNDLRLKIMATLLYTNLTKQNYKPLAFYPSSRGYSMHDASTTAGKFKILAKKYLMSKKKTIDGFNTKPTDELFLNYLTNTLKTNNELPLLVSKDLNEVKSADINSLVYWMNSIENRYL